LLNYVHGFQVTGIASLAHIARDIIRWMDEWLSDRERGGFYASQDADINLDDDGDYFTWTVAEAAAVLTEDEFKVAALHYDIGEVGEMHHNHAKNVLFVRASLEEIGRRLGKSLDDVHALLDSAKQKMYAARKLRPTPYIDKTVYVGWNALCIASYLQAARVLRLESALPFALRSLDRILTEAWHEEHGLQHVIAYSDPAAQRKPLRGMLDDYAYTVIACLDAYEATSDLRYFHFARKIGDAMIERFYDATGGGFFDCESEDNALGALTARRKPFQDSPTPAADPSAAIALLRLYAFTQDESYREKAECTLEVFAGLAAQYGMFAGAYGIAAAMFAQPHTQIVVIAKDHEDALAEQLYAAALQPFALNKSVVRITAGNAVPQSLPPALAATIPHLPAVRQGESAAVICSGFTCQPPISDPAALQK
ncbi:MAG: thioredoxin domain-containing protein, partial [Candidatus Acidiferrum sp.]